MTHQTRHASFRRWPLRGALALSVAMVFAARAQAQLPLTVPTANGLVAGTRAKADAVAAFLGIPFAAPPVGALRWKPPAPPADWRGVFKADHFGTSCVQAAAHGSAPAKPFAEDEAVPEPTGEDCLYLNVWTPARSASAKLPVMVWFYGGGFQVGSGAVPAYNGSGLAKQGVVVVSVNYRMGIFGFLAHPGLDKESPYGVSGNYGLLDEIAALHWVRANIDAFGGEKGNVTIFGQSAGGSSTHFLSISPFARGLFQRAIAGNSTMAPNDPFLNERSPMAYRTLAGAEAEHVRHLATLGVNSLEQLRGMTSGELAALPFGSFPPAYYRPVIDGWLLPHGFAEAYARGEQLDIPYIVGWTASVYPGLKPTLEKYQTWARAKYGALADEFLSLYPAHDDEEARLGVEHSAADSYRASIYLWALARRKTAPTYLYFFDHPLPGPDTKVLGARPGSEIPYVMNSLWNSKRPFTANDHRIAETTSAYWANFARTGDPNGAGLPHWPKVTLHDHELMLLGDTPGAQELLPEAKFDFFRRYFATEPTCIYGQPCTIKF